MTTAAEATTRTARRAVKKAVELIAEHEEVPVTEVVQDLLPAEAVEQTGRNFAKIAVAAGVLSVGIAGLVVAFKKYRSNKSAAEAVDEEQPA